VGEYEILRQISGESSPHQNKVQSSYQHNQAAGYTTYKSGFDSRQRERTLFLLTQRQTLFKGGVNLFLKEYQKTKRSGCKAYQITLIYLHITNSLWQSASGQRPMGGCFWWRR